MFFVGGGQFNLYTSGVFTLKGTLFTPKLAHTSWRLSSGGNEEKGQVHQSNNSLKARLSVFP